MIHLLFGPLTLLSIAVQASPIDRYWNDNEVSILKKVVLEPISDLEYWSVLASIGVLVIIGGTFAGLTIGLMSLDATNLSILRASGSAKEKAWAARIEPIRSNTHLLLVTLLLGNTVINETLPILFDYIHWTGWRAVVSSTVLIVIFGEIIPQAVCTRYGLQIGAFFAWPLRIFMFLVWIIAYPIAKLLDFALGKKGGVIYRVAQLKELVALHGEDQSGPLTKDEVSVLKAVLELRDKTVCQVMTNLEDVFMLPLDANLDRETLASILQAGHSRVPVYSGDRSNVMGVVLVKELILNDPDDNTPITSLKIRKLPRINENTPLFDMLHVFEGGGSHMALVLQEVDETYTGVDSRLLTVSLDEEFSIQARRRRRASTDPSYLSPANNPTMETSPEMLATRRYRPVGVVTLEDVIEELLGEEIIDETDVYVDVRTKVRVVRASKDFKRETGLGLTAQLRNLMTSPSLLPKSSGPPSATGSRPSEVDDEREPLLRERESSSVTATAPLTGGSRRAKKKVSLVSTLEITREASNSGLPSPAIDPRSSKGKERLPDLDLDRD